MGGRGLKAGGGLSSSGRDAEQEGRKEGKLQAGSGETTSLPSPLCYATPRHTMHRISDRIDPPSQDSPQYRARRRRRSRDLVERVSTQRDAESTHDPSCLTILLSCIIPITTLILQRLKLLSFYLLCHAPARKTVSLSNFTSNQNSNIFTFIPNRNRSNFTASNNLQTDLMKICSTQKIDPARGS